VADRIGDFTSTIGAGQTGQTLAALLLIDVHTCMCIHWFLYKANEFVTDITHPTSEKKSKYITETHDQHEHACNEKYKSMRRYNISSIIINNARSSRSSRM